METYWSTSATDGTVRFFANRTGTGTRRLSQNSARKIGLERFQTAERDIESMKLITSKMCLYHVTNTVEPLELHGGALTHPTYFYTRRPLPPTRYTICDQYKRSNSDPHFCRMLEYEIDPTEQPLRLLHLTEGTKYDWHLDVFHIIFGILISMSDRCPSIQQMLPLLQDYDTFLGRVTLGGRAGLLDRVAANVVRIFGDTVDDSCRELTGKSLYNFLKTSIADEFQRMGYDGFYEEYLVDTFVVLFEPSKHTRLIGTFSVSPYYYQVMTLFTFIGRNVPLHQRVSTAAFKVLYRQWVKLIKTKQKPVALMLVTDFMKHLKNILISKVYYGSQFAACDGIFKDAYQFYMYGDILE